jgi:hypothetical protein
VHGDDRSQAGLVIVEIVQGFVIVELEMVENAHFCPQQSTELFS